MQGSPARGDPRRSLVRWCSHGGVLLWACDNGDMVMEDAVVEVVEGKSRRLCISKRKIGGDGIKFRR